MVSPEQFEAGRDLLGKMVKIFETKQECPVFAIVDASEAQAIAQAFKYLADGRDEARAQVERLKADAEAAHGRYSSHISALAGRIYQAEIDRDAAKNIGEAYRKERNEACDQRDELKARLEDLAEVLLDEEAKSIVVIQLGERVFG